ncbi:MAG: helix-turn-helix transcriptional regulator [Microbacteriaceae bacterium]
MRAGTYAYDGPDMVTPWHAHDLDQIEYAFAGVAEVETAGAHYLLPPQQAIWIPAGLPHRTTLRGVRSISVFFDPAMVKPGPDDARVLAAAPVVREMVAYGVRWPISRPSNERAADVFFEALAILVVDWLDHASPLRLPTSDDTLVAAAIAVTNEHLADVDLDSVCAAIGTSQRTLRRRFLASTGMTWRQYVLESRLLRATAMLAEQQTSVLAVAVAVGFDSASSFARAFTRQFAETPSAYRRRVHAT